MVETMTKQALAIILLLGIALGTASSFPSREPTFLREDEWWANLPSSPLVMLGSPSKRDVSLENRSGDIIISYTMGCVIRTGTRWRVLRKLRRTNTNLEPGKALLNSASTYARSREECSERKAKLALVEVYFADGTTWMLR